MNVNAKEFKFNATVPSWTPPTAAVLPPQPPQEPTPIPAPGSTCQINCQHFNVF
jgi:hypothetical protein